MSIRRTDLIDAIESGHQTPVCAARDDGWLCTLIAGHDGPEHAAGLGSSLYAHLWPVGDRDPSEVTCPACQAPIGEPCTAPTNTGRRVVKWWHEAREARARG